jgi:chorismate synthase
MNGNIFGEAFAVVNWGESHGPAIGAVVLGCPPGIAVSQEIIQHDLNRRKPGQSDMTTQRQEEDKVHILSGVEDNESLGNPILLYIPNRDQRSTDYSDMETAFRPSHADYTYQVKYGRRAIAGGGRSSARNTVSTVAAGAIAKQILGETKVTAYVTKIKDVEAIIPDNVTEADVEKSPVRCPDLAASQRMMDAIRQAQDNQDSVGGIIECVVSNVMPGLGEPIFHKLEADLGAAILNIPAVTGFEKGSGFAAADMYGSEHNDPFIMSPGGVSTATNNSGGIQGGISNGMPIVLRASFKPTSTIGKEQKTITSKLEPTTIAAKGRHDPGVLPRAVPVVEAYVACVLADHLLRQRMVRLS